MELLGAMLVFALTLVIALLIINAVTPKREFEGRLKQLDELSLLGAAKAAGQEEASGWKQIVRNLGTLIESPYWDKLLSHKLVQGGVPLRSSEFAVLWIAGGCLLAAVIQAVLREPLGGLAAWLIGGAIGAFAPMLWLNLRIKKRRKQFNDQLSDALVLISNSLRTGYSFLQAVELVSRELPAPLGKEFYRMFQEMNLGVTTEVTLDNLGKRIESTDLDLVITAVLIQRQIGGNLSEVLDNIAHTIRSRLKLRGHIQTLTAQGRISGYIVGGLPFAIGGALFLINPDYMRVLFTDPAGKMMIGAGLASQFVGVMIIRKIVNIEL